MVVRNTPLAFLLLLGIALLAGYILLDTNRKASAAHAVLFGSVHDADGRVIVIVDEKARQQRLTRAMILDSLTHDALRANALRKQQQEDAAGQGQ